MLTSVLVKLPMWPLYYWLPETHVEASTEGSITLAGVLLKFTSLFIFRFISSIQLALMISTWGEVLVLLVVELSSISYEVEETE